jgi:hypothetical protein
MQFYSNILRITYVPTIKILGVNENGPGTVAERSRTCIVFARSEAEIVGSNPTQGMDVW